jgi:hypothetical protein
VGGACDDEDPYTTDPCEVSVGVCASPTPPGGCSSDTHPCQVSPVPGGSSDPAVNSCVCDAQGMEECCAQAWHEGCAWSAQTECGVVCGGCEGMDPTDLTCAGDADCGGCDDGDLCNGTWTCGDAGHCEAVAAPDCGALDSGCALGICDWGTGDCYLELDPSACDDGDACTFDDCDLTTGDCTWTPNPAGCDGDASPCTATELPGGSNDPEVNQCLCEAWSFPECCDWSWDSECVAYAETLCDVNCAP